MTIIRDQDGEHVEKKEHRVVSIFEVNLIDNSKASFMTQVREILCAPVFLCCLFIRAIMFGVNTAIQYWIGDYMRTVLEIEGGQILFSYTIIAVSGPLGGLFAGSIINFFIGGYENKHSSLALLFSHTIACIFGLSGPWVKSSFAYCILTTLYFVFNSVALPLIQGIILTSVKPEYKSTAFSIANFSTMLLTSGPFPFLYGAINDIFKERYPYMAMLSLFIICTLAIIPMLFMCFFRYKTFSIDQMEKLVDFDKDDGRSTIDNYKSSNSNSNKDIELHKRKECNKLLIIKGK